MSRVAIPITIIGNEFVVPQTRLRVVTPLAIPRPLEVLPAKPVLALGQPRQFLPPTEVSRSPVRAQLGRPLNFMHRHSLVTFALLFLLVGSAATQVTAGYWTAHIENVYKTSPALESAARPIAGLNMTVASGQLQAKLQTITSQPATLTVGSQSLPIDPDTIKSWLQITSSADKSQDYIRIKAGAIAASLNQLANQFAKAPVNQVTIDPAGVSRVVVAGSNGAALSDPNSLKIQAGQIAKTVMDAKGLQFNTPLQTVPFQAVTPGAFNKSLYVDLVTKQMYAYQGDQLVNTFAVSAGAPITPTPVGEFKVYAKYATQDMSGYNPDGTKYFQPHVPWVNYFSGGDAIHGNYWRPASVFGSVNTSHGCVSVPVNEGQWIYDWAPIGTTVVTYT